jgi:hypothetical protein
LIARSKAAYVTSSSCCCALRLSVPAVAWRAERRSHRTAGDTSVAAEPSGACCALNGACSMSFHGLRVT